MAKEFQMKLDFFPPRNRKGLSLAFFLSLFLSLTSTSLWAQTPRPDCAYVANFGSGSNNTISAYSVNPTSGALTFVGDFTTNPGPTSLTVDLTGQFLYVPSIIPVIDFNTGQVAGPISVYSIDSSCILRATSRSLVSNSDVPLSVAVASDALGGQYAYATMFLNGGLSAYTVSPSTGALTPTQPPTFPTGLQPSGVTVDRNSKFVYTANGGSNNISGLAINPTSGALTPIVGSPFGAGSSPVSIVIHPTNNFAYVANLSSQDILGYTIDPSTGALTQMGCSPFGGGVSPLPFTPVVPTSNSPIAAHPTGKFVYAATSQGVFILSVDTSAGSTAGCLTLQLVPVAPATNPSTITIDSTGSFAYVTDYVSSSISSYSINRSIGALTPISGSATQTGPGPISVITTGGSSGACRVALQCIGADFNGDGKADLGVFRPSSGNWFIIPSSSPGNFIVQQWGTQGDILVRGDYDGDGLTDIAVFRPSSGTWFVIPSSNPSVPILRQWGTQGDIPVPGDYDDDGKTDFAVFRPSTGTWFIIPSSNPSVPIIRQWGTQADIPVPGDYDGDAKMDTAVFRPSNGVWFIIPSSNPSAPIIRQWGTQADIPVPGDYDGDGKTDTAVFRPSNGVWFIIPSSNPNSPIIQQWGTIGDIPVPVDYDGDRKTDIAVWRPSNGNWYIILSSTPSTFTVTQWGTVGDVPVQKPIGQ